MKKIKVLLFVILSMFVLSTNAQLLAKGVSKELAEHRKDNISNVIYDLTFNIPASLDAKITGKAVISFDLKLQQDVILDFQGELNGKSYVYKKLKKRSMPVARQNEHIIIPAKVLQAGTNKVEFSFTCLDKALNRSRDYMYTLFVPDMARTVFPCFEQPDLRAVFATTLNMPEGWKAMASDNSCQLPTYLYSFVAGRFEEKATVHDGRPMRALYMETDPYKVAQIDDIFNEAAQSLKWMEGYTGIACPFKEYGIAILPGYQFGGMEHPGAIQLNDRRVFLDKNATQEEALGRMELIAHETAHLWFGDLVALKWFDDVWAKEVFASFMASKITRRSFSKVDHDLNFIKTYQARAIATDRTEGTHPIAQDLDNLNHASLLYDNIIYDKAPVMMRMLELMMGSEKLQGGLQRYLIEHSFGNASWEDLVRILDEAAPAAGVRQFSEVWVKQKGMPLIHTAYRDGQIVVSQTDPYGRGVVWPQKFQVRLIYDRDTSRTLTVDMQQPTAVFKVNGRPDFIIPNADGRGYGRFTTDDEYAQQMPKRLITTRNDLNRYCLLLTIHDNYLMGKIPPSHFSELYRMMMNEKNPLIMSTAIDHMFKIATDMSPEQRQTLELCMMDLLEENKGRECRQHIVRKLGANATSPEVLDWIEQLWTRHDDPLFSERDYMDMAYRLAIMRPGRWQEILGTQRTHLLTDELRQEFDYVSRACTPDANERTNLFNQLLKPENRTKEPWALQTLRLLNADVFEPQSNSYIEPSLQSLEYIQQTSDIFFPANWMKALLASHKSDAARQTVERFVKNSPNYPDNLKNKVLQASWMLTKQQSYTGKAKSFSVGNLKNAKAALQKAEQRDVQKKQNATRRKVVTKKGK